MNPNLTKLQPYPFEKLRQLFQGITPNPAYTPISLGLGEPRHPTPALVEDSFKAHLAGLANYPLTAGIDALRQAIADWIAQRYQIPAPDAATEILPVNGSREALFAFAQAVVDASGSETPWVMCPNPFYQIYEGAAYLAGAQACFVNSDPALNFAPDYDRVDDSTWARTQLIYVCSPGNPAGAVLPASTWEKLFALSDRFGFVIAADECYSEIYFGEQAPLGALEAAYRCGRTDYRNLVVFSSLSKRSNAPGMRSGFVAGDRALIKRFLLYRTYHGSAMSLPVQHASIAAWRDERHVEQNRQKYREKFAVVTPMLQEVLDVKLPDAGFYLWARCRGLSDTEYAKGLYAEYNVTVLPGSYLARDAHGVNPGLHRIRMALVAELEECVEAAHRIVEFSRRMAAR